MADVFDALTADRPYRKAIPILKALDVMRGGLDTAFDPECFAAPERVFTKIEGGSRSGGMSWTASRRSVQLPDGDHRAGANGDRAIGCGIW